jgi:hypothetical protein
MTRALRLVRLLALSSHPGPTATVTVLAAGLAVALGYGLGRVIAVALAVLLGQLSIGLSNDWIDAGRGHHVHALELRPRRPAGTGAEQADPAAAERRAVVAARDEEHGHVRGRGLRAGLGVAAVAEVELVALGLAEEGRVLVVPRDLRDGAVHGSILPHARGRADRAVTLMAC